jgi:hypothetical protein
MRGGTWTYGVWPELDPVGTEGLDREDIVEIVFLERGMEVDILGQGARRRGVLVEERHGETTGVDRVRSMSSLSSVLIRCEGEGILYICIRGSLATPASTVVTAYRLDRVYHIS